MGWRDSPLVEEKPANKWASSPVTGDAAEEARFSRQSAQALAPDSRAYVRGFEGEQDQGALAGVAGTKHSWDRLAEGVKSLLPQAVQEAGDNAEAWIREKLGLGPGVDISQQVKEGKEFLKEHGGWQGKTGEVLGTGVLTAPIGGALSAGAKALPLAGQAAANVGGRFLNPGTVGRAATEAGLVGGIYKPGEGESRLGNVAQSAAEGAVLSKAVPALVGGVTSAGKWVGRKALDLVTGGNRQATLNAVGALDRTVGKAGIDEAAEAVRNPTPSMFPRTTAAMAQNPQLGALEAGVANRPHAAAELGAHREAVAREADKQLNLATRSAVESTSGLERIAREGGDEAAEAAARQAQRIRGSFSHDLGDMRVPVTGKSYGSFAENNRVPEITEGPLRRALGRHGAGMVPEERKAVAQIADELAPQDIYKSGIAIGSGDVVPGKAGAALGAVMSALPGTWKYRPAVASLIKGANETEQRLIDQALVDPQKFLKMVETQRALGRPLEGWQAKLRDVLMGGTAREVGAASSGD